MTRRTCVVRVAVAAALVAAAVPVSGSSAAGTKAFTWSGKGCEEVLVAVLLPTATLQPLLPRGYTVQEAAPGKGQLSLGLAQCASMEVEGVEQPRDTSADALIRAETADGDQVDYHLWQVTGAPALRHRMQQLGVRGQLSPKAFATSTTTSPATATGTADVPWSFAPHSVTATGAEVLPPGSGTMTWVQVTRRGTVDMSFEFEGYEMLVGAGRLTAPAGSWLARLMGGTQLDGVGYLSDPFDVDARVELRGS